MAGEVLNVVVCGTCFGEHYLAAIARLGGDVRLAGILARGGARSRALAAHLDVPLYRDVADLPADIDVACVVVRTTLFGGDGTRLAEALLKRGIHVLQEHPVHPGEVASLRRQAEAAGVRYHVNSFYPHLPAFRHFIAYASAAGERAPAAFAEVTTSPQLLYSALDGLGRSLGSLAGLGCVGPLVPPSDGLPFHAFQGRVGGVPFSLMLQSWLDPADPDHHSLVMHRMAVGWPEGTVNLVNSFGPVVWSHSLYAPDYRQDGEASSYLLSPERHAGCRHFTQPSAHVLGSPAGAPFWDVVHAEFPEAIGHALAELRCAIEAPGSVPWQSDAYLADLGKAWLAVLRQAGPPRERAMPVPPPPHPDPVEFARTLTDAD